LRYVFDKNLNRPFTINLHNIPNKNSIVTITRDENGDVTENYRPAVIKDPALLQKHMEQAAEYNELEKQYTENIRSKP